MLHRKDRAHGADLVDRWGPLRVLAMLAVFLPLLASSCGGGRRPDLVVLILLDTVRYDTLGCYGSRGGTTPHMDALAADGVRFDQAISTSGWTLPAVASLLTGALPTIHGASGRKGILTPIREELATAPELLKEAGFETLAFANAAFVSPLLELDRGFDVFDHRHTYNWDTRRADATFEAALEHLRDEPDRKRFVLIHLFDPHLDYDPPEPFRDRFTGDRTTPAPPLDMKTCRELEQQGEGGRPDREDIDYIEGLYRGEVAFVDQEIGRFLDELRRMGLYDDSLILLTADHGEEFWDHGGFEHGHTLYDELIRVPLLVKLPAGAPPASSRVADQVRVLDVMPTVFDLLGLSLPETFSGRSLLPLIRGQDDEEDRTAFSESTLYGAQRIALRKGGYKYIHEVGATSSRSGELYDWRKDPDEQINLAEMKPEVAARMHSELYKLYVQLLNRARNLKTREPVDLSPRHVEMLKSLGYIR